uniref:Uncharacterized protein n=1 Tax=Anguilla anguilla TaxID=7936 RepID=A0A0E9WVW6_ANGAN
MSQMFRCVRRYRYAVLTCEHGSIKCACAPAVGVVCSATISSPQPEN